jgi:hypothetical protein
MSEPPIEKRRAYRVTPETIGHIRASAVLDDGVEAAAELLNAATGGVAVRFPHLRRGDLEAGQKVTFCFRSDRLYKPLALVGQVVQVRRGRALPLEAGIAFVDWARASRDLEPVFRRLFNERRCFRVPPSTEDVERFRIVLRAKRGTRSVRTWLRDISASGIGLWLPTKKVLIPDPSSAEGGKMRVIFGGHDTPAGIGEPLQLKLDMPGQRDPFELPVTLRHIAAWPGAPRARLGLEFPAERDMPRDAHAAILKYVGDRQRQLRQMEKEAREQVAEEARPLEATGAAMESPTKG